MPRRPALDRAAVVAAGLALVQEEGADALGINRLARKLGIKPPSLYNHVKSGEDLANRILSGIPGTPMPSHSSVFKMDGKGGEPQTDDLWALVHYVQSLIRPDAQELAVQCQKQLTVRRVTTVPEDPADSIWKSGRPVR